MNDAWKYCGARNPQGPVTSACVRRQGHEIPLHRDLSGREWQDPLGVRTPYEDNLLRANQMLSRRVDSLGETIAALQKQMGEFEAEVQGLVVWLRDEGKTGVPAGVVDAPDAFEHVADRLVKILDGE